MSVRSIPHILNFQQQPRCWERPGGETPARPHERFRGCLATGACPALSPQPLGLAWVGNAREVPHNVLLLCLPEPGRTHELLCVIVKSGSCKKGPRKDLEVSSNPFSWSWPGTNVYRSSSAGVWLTHFYRPMMGSSSSVFSTAVLQLHNIHVFFCK